MAIVTNIGPERTKTISSKKHSQTSCTYLMGERDGNPIIHLITTGSADREKVGETSQTLQFDEKAAKELFDILRREFDF